MKRFQFPLESLRALRAQKEQAAQRCYAQVLRDVEAAEQRVQITVAELESCWSWLRDELTDGAFAERLETTRAYCELLDQRRKQEEEALRHARERLNEAWQVMMIARREREALDRFLEKCRRAHALAAQREEQKLLDEVGTRQSIDFHRRAQFDAAKMECV